MKSSNINNDKDKIIKRKRFNFKKILIYLIITFFVLLLLYNNIYLLSGTSLNTNRKNNIFNIKLYLVENNMMEDTLKKGNIAVISTKTIEYNIDDIILFRDQSGIKLERIVEIINSNTNIDEKKYITKSDNSYYLNHFEIEEDMIIGKYRYKILGLSILLKIARSRITTIIFILVLITMLIILFQIRLYKPRRGKGVKEDELLKKRLDAFINKDEEQIKGKHSRKIQRDRLRRKLEKKNKS